MGTTTRTTTRIMTKTEKTRTARTTTRTTTRIMTKMEKTRTARTTTRTERTRTARITIRTAKTTTKIMTRNRRPVVDLTFSAISSAENDGKQTSLITVSKTNIIAYI